MAGELDFLPELVAEKESLDPSFVHCMRLLDGEIERLRNVLANPQDQMAVNDYNGGLHPDMNEPHQGSEPPSHGGEGRPRQGGPKMFRRPNDFDQVSKLSEKVMVPVKDFPKFNFVGKILGPRGNTLKRLQAQTGTKMSVLGRGSMRDREKEEELRKAGDDKYQHLNDPLHVLIEVEASQSESHLRLAAAISELKKHMSPTSIENDDIRQQQMQEMAYLQSLDNPDAVPPLPPHVQQVQEVQVAPPQMARGRARPMFPGMSRGAPSLRGSPMQRGGRIMKTLIARSPGGPGGMPRMPGGMMAPRHAAQAPDPFKSFSISQMAVPHHMVYGAFSDATYDAAYETGFQEGHNEEVYYDFTPGETVNFAPPSSSNYSTTAAFKAPVRQLKRSVREATFPY